MTREKTVAQMEAEGQHVLPLAGVGKAGTVEREACRGHQKRLSLNRTQARGLGIVYAGKKEGESGN